MGPQGSGKSTQAALLAQKLTIPHVSTGDIYRAISQEDTDLGHKVKGMLDRGELIDDETTFRVVDRHLGAIQGGFIIDGFPRTLVQAQREAFLVDKVIYLKLSDEEATKRLLARGRADDTPELIAERLKLYHQLTEPILSYYRQQNKLAEVDGTASIEEVHQLVLRALGLDQ